ncbi:uncharacterized protein NECHADRAFT_89343 [Fusarium vanettenii 77-13-4]|uniref:Uncharacterized protein n=1 Tax=Fusarium vanettenii (strain ATCC MYA-4622 / CBS 123669 / FGSC 9596 / NRRL 45880 / 77-13-4) TaxID=660122 RepID=C7ZR78_FUSV7|nr:uncharacterized protein NECHADRAFT_89343 [Fusarium vanettenii 77-13-4]EEU33480.1 predicted protein [Fusarium vanettenii 77-13-4]
MGTLEAAKEVLKGSPFSLNLAKSKEKAIEDLKLEGLKALEALQDLPKQHSLLLLRGSIQLLLRHLQRQLDPAGLEDLWEEADTLIREAIIALVARSPTLPVREGGLGIPLHRDLAHELFLAAREASQPTLGLIRKPLAQPTLDQSQPNQGQPRLGKTAQQVLKEANKARLAGFLEDLPPSYRHARLENASYLGHITHKEAQKSSYRGPRK